MTRKLYSLFLAFCFLVSFSGTCSAQYQITEAELTRLEQIFNQLEANNNQLLIDLEQSKQDLTLSRERLEQYQMDLALLQSQLLELRKESAKARTELEVAQSLFEKVNLSCKQLEAEKSRLKWQRNLGYLLALGFSLGK